MPSIGTILVVVLVVAGIGGFAFGYLVHPATTTVTRVVPQTVALTGYGFSCGPSSQAPYLEGLLQFNLTSTYSTDVVVSVAYTGNWTGDTNQLVHPNSTKHVAVTWGPGKMQNIQVTQCPTVGLVIWLVQQDLVPCPNPPCDAGLISGPGGTPTAWGVNIGKSGDQSNWTLTFTSIPSSAATSSVFITIRNAAGAAVTGATNVPFSTIATGGAAGYKAMYFTPNTAGSVTTGDVLRLSAVSYPTGYQVQIVSGTSVVYTHALQ